MAALVSPSDYARSKGLTRQTISEAIDAGRIPTEIGPRGRKMIDPAAADIALAALTDHAQAEAGKGNSDGKGESNGRSAWINTKTESERIKCELLGLELAELRGELIRKDMVEQQFGPMLANVRDQILAVGSRIAPQILGCKTIAEISRLIDNANREAMRHIGAKIPGPGETS